MYTPRSFSSVICFITLLLLSSLVMWYSVHIPWPICMTLHLLELSFRSHLLDYLAKLFRSSCKLSSSASVLITFQILTSSANILILFLIQSGRSLTKSKKSRGPSTEPWGTPGFVLGPMLFLLLVMLELRKINFAIFKQIIAIQWSTKFTETCKVCTNW